MISSPCSVTSSGGRGGGSAAASEVSAGFGGGGGGSQQRRYRGSDLRVKVKMTLKEISTGVEKKFKLKKYVPCNHCHGTGAEGDGGSETCPTCKGSGSVIRNQQTILGTMRPAPLVLLVTVKVRSSRTSVKSVVATVSYMAKR